MSRGITPAWLLLLPEASTAVLVAELTGRLNSGDFAKSERVYSPLARLILSEENLRYPELNEPLQEIIHDA